jgi:competence transcription factor ComK
LGIKNLTKKSEIKNNKKQIIPIENIFDLKKFFKKDLKYFNSSLLGKKILPKLSGRENKIL